MRIAKGLFVTAGVVAGGLAVRRLVTRDRVTGPRGLANLPNPTRSLGADSRERWHAVTVYAQPEALKPDGRLPAPLSELGDRIEVRITPAPGDKGTELAARLLEAAPRGLRRVLRRDDDPVAELRSALRRTKQLIETGEVLSADRPTTARRTPLNRPLEAVTRRAAGEGRL